MTARWILKPFAKAARDNRGGVAVEFALTVPFFLIFVMGLIDFGRLYWIKSSMQFAVEETARYAMVNPSLAPSTLVTYAEGRNTSVSGITFSVTSSTSAGISYRTVTASYNFSFLIPMLPLGDIALDARSSTPVNLLP
ncbi:TadE/TadG family type IV pilus assembly protein [Pseudomonadota bacterium]